MNLSLIEKLKTGEYVLHYNNGNLEQLREVMKAAFPNEKLLTSGVSTYYFKVNNLPWEWDGSYHTERPTIKLSEIYGEEKKEWQPTNGEMVEVSDSAHFNCSEERKFFTMDGSLFVCHDNDNDYGYTAFYYCRPARVTLTVQEVADKFNIDPTRLNKELK